MITFLIGFLLIPSVLGSCSKEAGDCWEGTCSDSCFVWRGPNGVDDNLHFCTGDDVVEFISDSTEACEATLGLPDYAGIDWDISFFSFDKICILLEPNDDMTEGPKNMGQICECKKCIEPPPTPPPTPTPKSKLSTEAIIGITLGTLLIISIIAFIFRNQLPFRFAKQTGQQLIQ